MIWNVTLELGESPVAEERADALMEALVDYHPAVGVGYRGSPSVTISLPAENLRQALSTAIVLIESAAGSPATYAEAMPTSDFDEREGFLSIPGLLSASAAGEYLGVSRVRVNQMIDEGRFPTAQKVGNGYVIPTDEVWHDARLHTMIGWSGIDIAEEHRRQVIDPLLDALRIVGPIAAYRAARAKANGEIVANVLTEAWQDAERDALQELAMLGYETNGVTFNADRTRVLIGAR